jgi:hypothetical protein
VPSRVRAPHRDALAGFSGGLAFFNKPRRFAWGSSEVLLCIPTPRSSVDCAHNGLTARLHGDVLHRHFLLPPPRYVLRHSAILANDRSSLVARLTFRFAPSVVWSAV